MKTLKVLEVMWFSIAVFSLSVGIFKCVTSSITESMWYFIIALIAFAFGFVRRKQRLKAETETKDY